MRRIYTFGIFFLLLVILMGKRNALGEEKIVFTLQKNANLDIALIDINGENPKNLTNHPSRNRHPAPSPNGRYIAFNSDRNGKPQIFIMDADGKNPRLLIDDATLDRPTWSPDSKWVAFVKGVNIVAVNINSGEVKEIFKTAEVITSFSSWSPDGKKIAFRLLDVEPGEKGDIYTIDIDENLNGKNLRRLTKDPANDIYPSWSPDSKKIVFYSARDGGGIYVMDSDGANVKKIHRSPIDDDCCPSWSPDGRKIAFSSIMGNGIFVMDSDGSNVKQIFEQGAMPSWLRLTFFNVESESRWKTMWGKIKRNL